MGSTHPHAHPIALVAGVQLGKAAAGDAGAGPGFALNADSPTAHPAALTVTAPRSLARFAAAQHIA